MGNNYIKWFDEISLEDVALVGGKNASLGEMYRELSSLGIKVPYGLAVTVEAFHEFMKKNDLDRLVREVFQRLDVSNLQSLAEEGCRLREAVVNAPWPRPVEEAIIRAYDEMVAKDAANGDVAVRSSATAEDLPTASFAGQLESFLHVQGQKQLLSSCRKCFASLYTDRAISYCFEKKLSNHPIGVSVVVQRMVRSDLGTAGIIFTLDTESGHPDILLINASYGLGENIVQGKVNPDEFLVFKPTLKMKPEYRPVIKRKLGAKETKMVYATGGTRKIQQTAVTPEDRARFCLDDDDIMELSRWSCWIEDHYSRKSGRWSPMDIEWAKDGNTGENFIVQARPETVHSQSRGLSMDHYTLKGSGPLLLSGTSVGNRIGRGKVHIIRHVRELAHFRPGEVLVAESTSPDWVSSMKVAAAIVTNSGGRTCHAAIVGREMGVPTVVGTKDATTKLKNGQEVTVVCSAGPDGHIYGGMLDYEVEKVDPSEFRQGPEHKVSKAKLEVILADPSQALKLSLLPNDGVGLLRIEFLISHAIGIHPMALVRYGELEDEDLKREIQQRTSSYEDKTEFFVDRLAEGVGLIAAAFYPREVIVRLSDFKTNEYARLLGGEKFEPHEENPMLGFRGASRYYHEKYREGFALECLAMKKVRETMGLTNLKIMIPFCRTVKEGKRVLAEMEKNGLQRGRDDLEIFVMCEIPSNVLSAAEFSALFDGFSIGSNDLTQLTLGVDRDSELLAPLFDEEDPAVKKLVSEVIKVAHSKGRKVGICGQAPSDKPEFLRFLLREGIDSISVNPDSLLSSWRLIQKALSP